jgi:CRISPR system Cascade subunit CasE
MFISKEVRMHLSKVLLLPGRLDNAWEWHRALWTLFPGIERQPNEAAPFLYRIEQSNLVAGIEVLMQSNEVPQTHSAKARVLATRPLNPRPENGQSLAFLLTANVTKAIRDKNQPSRKIRVPLINEDEQLDWLKRKFDHIADLGSNLLVQTHPPTYFRKGQRPGKIVPVSFEGLLCVSDSNTLVEIMGKGIGPAKAFGCGLLLVRRI